MNKMYLEPGLLKVFRWFTWLRVLSLVFIPMMIFRASIHQTNPVNRNIPILITVLDVLVLLVYLYIPHLETRLGKYYFPLAIVIASVTLLMEQYILPTYLIGWQQYPFLFVLLILVAWQYRFREVVIYTIGLAILEAILILIFIPRTNSFFEIPEDVQRMIVIGLLFSRTIIFIILGYVVTTLMSAQRKQRLALAEANQKLIQHAEILEQLTISRERNRISRELHDTLAHTLSALAVQIEALLTVCDPMSEKSQHMLEQMLSTTRSGLDETRRSLSALRSSQLEEMGLALAVRTMAEDFALRHAVKLDLDIPDNLDDLPADVEQCYYRVAQEALTNIANHSDADKIKVSLDYIDGGLRLIVNDNGKGFDVNALAEDDVDKLGIRGMRERADLISAELIVDSEPGKGTTIELYKRYQP
jgi:signal transduction histidine kinase